MIERLGDKAAFEIMQRHLAWMRSLAAAHDGREVEMRGDACLLGFGAPETALAYATEIQRVLNEARRTDPAHALSLRIGLHLGRPISHANVYFGRDVVLVARLADACPRNGILASRSFQRRLRGPRLVGRERRLALKGFAEHESAARIFWVARPNRSGALRNALRSASSWVS
jgi:class 3 adenylate cyclase